MHDRVQKTIEHDIEVLLISTLMLPAALKVEEVREKLLKDGHAPKIVVGGAPFRFDTELWKAVGADALGKNASEIIGILERLITDETS